MTLLQAYLDAHGGVLSTAAAHDQLGMTTTDLSRAVNEDVLVRVCRGGYVDATRLAAATPEEAHRLRTRAVLATAPDSFGASHQSAAVLLGLPLLAKDLELVHVTQRSGTGHGRRRDAFHVHPCPVDGGEFRRVDGAGASARWRLCSGPSWPAARSAPRGWRTRRCVVGWS